MPVYEYRCDNGHNFELIQRMADDPLEICTECEAPVQKVMHQVAIHFKGKGFYKTDYGSPKTAESGSDSKDPGSKGSDSKDSGSKEPGTKDSGGKDSGSKDSSAKGESGAKSSDGSGGSGSSGSNGSGASGSEGGSSGGGAGRAKASTRSK